MLSKKLSVFDMDIFKIIALGLAAVVLSNILKGYKSEHSIMVILITSVVFFFYIIVCVNNIFDYISSVCGSFGLDISYFKILFKILGVTYICEFASALCKDSGESAVGVKIDIAGRVTIVMLVLPLFKNFVELITKIMP